MKKLTAILFLIFLSLTFVLANDEKLTSAENLSEIVYDKSNIYETNIKNKKYICHINNCYDFKSLRYNKLTKTYSIETVFDLMKCNAHEEYKSPKGEGYITHLIFDTKMNKDKITVKCKGYATGNIVLNYKEGKPISPYYNIKGIYKGKPKTIKNIKEFENISLDKKYHAIIIKNLANKVIL